MGLLGARGATGSKRSGALGRHLERWALPSAGRPPAQVEANDFSIVCAWWPEDYPSFGPAVRPACSDAVGNLDPRGVEVTDS